MTCEYIGPGEHTEMEQIQIVQDLISKGVDGIAVAPSNAPAMAKALRAAQEAGIAVMTWDSDLLPEDAGLRTTYVGTYNYDIGVNLAKLAMARHADGGTICLQTGGAAAANHNERLKGARDTLAGADTGTPPGATLAGEGGWTEISGCPLITNDDGNVAVNGMTDILAANPDMTVFLSTGAFTQWYDNAYRQAVEPYMGRLNDGSPHHRRRRYAADADGAVGRGPRERQRRSASLRDGLHVHVHHEGHRRGQAGRRPDLYRSRRLQ